MIELTKRLRADITDLASGMRWIEELVCQRAQFHLEDDPADIMDGLRGGMLFKAEDVALIKDRVRKLYALEWDSFECPIGYMIDFERGGAIMCLVDEFNEWFYHNGTYIPHDADPSAESLVKHPEWFSPAQLAWLKDFIARWNSVAEQF